MATEYEELQADAAEIIEEYGRQVAIRRRVISGPLHSPDITYQDDVPVYAVVGDAQQNEIDGSKVRVGDKRFLFVSDIQVDTTMYIVDADGTVYSIGKVRETKPGPTTITQIVWGRA